MKNRINILKQVERTTIAESRSSDDAITESRNEHRHLEEQVQGLSDQPLKNKNPERRNRFSTQEEELETLKNHINILKQVERTIIAESKYSDDAITKSRTEHKQLEEQVQSPSDQPLKNKNHERRNKFSTREEELETLEKHINVLKQVKRTIIADSRSSDDATTKSRTEHRHLEEQIQNLSDQPLKNKNPEGRNRFSTQEEELETLETHIKILKQIKKTIIAESRSSDDAIAKSKTEHRHLEKTTIAESRSSDDAITKSRTKYRHSEKQLQNLSNQPFKNKIPEGRNRVSTQEEELETLNNHINVVKQVEKTTLAESSSNEDAIAKPQTKHRQLKEQLRDQSKQSFTFNKQEVNLENCGRNREFNRTLISTTPKYNLKAQMDRLTNVESRVHSLMAQLDLLTNL